MQGADGVNIKAEPLEAEAELKAGDEELAQQPKALSWMFVAWGASVLATLGSLYFSEVMQFEPCSLCWFQRIFMYPIVLLLGMAYARKDTSMHVYVLPLAIIGALFSIYHIAIQKLGTHLGDLAPACGRVPCSGDYLNAFGFITIPMLALAAFVIIIVALFQVRRLR